MDRNAYLMDPATNVNAKNAKIKVILSRTVKNEN